MLAQTRRADQVLIIDDGSKDDTVAVASRYAPAVEVITQVNAGPAAARNHGLDLATGDLIAFLDADDLWLPEKLARQEAFLLASPDLVGVGGGFIEFGHGPEAAFAVPDDAASRRLTALDYLVGFLFYPSTLMIRRSLGGAVRFPKGLEGEDLILRSDAAHERPDRVAARADGSQARACGAVHPLAESLREDGAVAPAVGGG